MDELTRSLYYYYVGWTVALAVGLYVFRLATAKRDSESAIVTGEFKRFQRKYVVVFLIMMMADWLQGPYVYALYQHYGFSISDIGVLFIAGFGSSMVFGSFVGSLADKYGRKLMCIAFGVMYSICCLTKHSHDYSMLMVGRILGGISTSILFSCFESWMVHEHHERGYPEDWLGLTFSVCTSGNGIVAIVAGVLASIVRDMWGPVAPFDLSLGFLVAGTAIVVTSWSENTGDSQGELGATLSGAMHAVQNDRKVLLLGLIQSLFEGAMYIFVFMWTPALESTSEADVYHGWVFASFMICVLIGSTLFSYLLEKGQDVALTAFYMFIVAAGSLLVPAFFPNHSIRLLSFFVFEVCCGVFWPSLGMLRGRYVPENVRATVMNIFRVPLNMIVILVLYNIGNLSEFTVFITCALCLVPAAICQAKLLRLMGEADQMKNESLV